MHWIAILVALVLVAAAVVVWQVRTRLGGPVERVEPPEDGGSLWELGTRSLEGEVVDLERYRGQVALVVNVASRCGLTRQYEGLEELHEELSPRGFTVLGFPSNDFLNQEPGTAEDIREFCSTTYGVTFPLFEKRPVTGEEKDEVYRFLSKNAEEPTWNFTKYLVDRQGRVLARFSPKTTPDAPELRQAIEAALGD